MAGVGKIKIDERRSCRYLASTVDNKLGEGNYKSAIRFSFIRSEGYTRLWTHRKPRLLTLVAKRVDLQNWL